MNTLKKDKEFQKIYKKNTRLHSKYSLVFYNKNNKTTPKFGIVASKKTGNAVKRNRIKRIIREIIRKNIKLFNNNFDYIIVAKSILKDTQEIKYKDLENDLLKIIGKIKNEKNTYFTN